MYHLMHRNPNIQPKITNIKRITSIFLKYRHTAPFSNSHVHLEAGAYADLLRNFQNSATHLCNDFQPPEYVIKALTKSILLSWEHLLDLLLRPQTWPPPALPDDPPPFTDRSRIIIG